jgi:hypothetical protein
MNSFTSSDPSFAYESREARKALGIPNRPEVHLAVTDLAEKLLAIAATSNLDQAQQRIAALRVASGAVIFGWPLRLVEIELRSKLDLPVETEERPTYYVSNEKDWLSEAVARLREEGVVVRPDFQKQRSNYGWGELAATA